MALGTAAPTHPLQTKDAKWLDGKDAEELVELEDEFADDRFLEQYRYEIWC